MKKSILFVITIILIFSAVMVVSRAFKKQPSSPGQELLGTSSNDTIPSIRPDSTEPINFTANFEIYTNTTKRIFTEAKYHNQSPDVYIAASDPSKIYIKKPNITWDDFFKTLPFSVTKDCLITGTKQTFCTSGAQKLKFFINQTETPNALNLEIKEGDFLKIIYGE